MDNQSSVYRSILIPIGISFFSVLGICLALLIVYLDKPQAVISMDQTITPFKYLLLATETRAPGSEEVFLKEPNSPTFAITPEEESLIISATPLQINALGTNSSSISTVTPTIEETELVVVDQYDDADTRIDHDGSWVSETDVENAYQETLHVSNTVGNDAVFSFVGRQIIIGYQGGVGLGTIIIYIDDAEFQLDQSAGTEWVSPQLVVGEHFVIIIHESGASINLDYINILDSS